MFGERVGEILKRAGVLDDLQLRSAVARQAQWGGRIGKHVAEMGFAREDAVVAALAVALSMQRVSLGMMGRDPGAVAKVPLETAEDKGVFPYALRDNGKTLWLAMADPTDLATVDDIASRSGCRVKTSIAGEKEIVAAIWRHYRNQEPPAVLVNGSALSNRASESLEMAEEQVVASPQPAPIAVAPPASMTSPTPLPWSLNGYTPPNGSRVTLGAEFAASLPRPAVDEVHKLRVELERTTRVVRGLIDLLVEKGYVGSEELRVAIAKFAAK